MDRLTYKYDDKWCISGVNGKLISDKHANYWGEAVDRLAAYENAGIEPCDYNVVRASYEEAERAKKDLSVAIDKLGERMKLLKAEEQGRLVILPCKIGDTVYRVMADKRIKQPYEYKVIGFWYSADETCNNLHLVRYVNGVFDSSISVPFSEFNRILFLTKEEARAALNNA